jgi:hypothetical protein
MGSTVGAQFAETLSAFMLGAASGALYDLFRVIRERIRLRAVTAVCDLLFCIAAGLSLFALGMTIGEGRHRVALGVLAATGAGMYFLALSPPVRFVFRKCADIAEAILRILAVPALFLCRLIKKFAFFSKKLFHYSLKWFIFGERYFMRRELRGEFAKTKRNGRDGGNEKNEYAYENSNRAGYYGSARDDNRQNRNAASGATRESGAARGKSFTRSPQRGQELYARKRGRRRRS